MPFGIAPTGFTRMMQTEGELAGAAAAADAGIPFALSTMGTTSIEDVAAIAPHGRKWFQLYMWTDRDRSMALVRRAADAGFDTPARHGRRPGRGRAPARHAQRDDDPADPHPAHGARRAPAAAVVVRPAHDRAARLRDARPLVGQHRGPHRRDVRPDRDLRGPRLDPGAVAGPVRGEGRPVGGGRGPGRRPRRRRRAAVQPRRPSARPRPDPVPPPARRRARGGRPHRGPRSTRGSRTGPTSSRRSRSARGSRSSAAPTSTV